MTKYTISGILSFTNDLPNDEERVKCLRANPILANVLRFSMDPNIKWLLPEGDPPYKPCEDANTEKRFMGEVRKLYLFVEGGNPNLKPLRRETIFVEMLESIHPDDAKLLLQMKDQKLPYKKITTKLVREAYPGLF